MKTAFIFSGQGAQKLGMARDLYEKFPLVKSTFDHASELLGYDIRALIDEDEDKLNDTQYTQPAILVTSVSIWRLLKENGITPDIVAGLSLGEYTALVAAGALDFDAAVLLVAKRGQYMAETAPSGSGKMVAVLNTEVALIEKVCKEASDKGIVSPANYNTPQQIVIGGETVAVDEAVKLLTNAGVKRMIELKVSGPFHTAILKQASDRLARKLESVTFKKFELPLVSNTSAEIMTNETIKELLTQQVMKPVRWYESVEVMQEFGVTQFVEVGPGKTLSGFIKKIVPNIKCANVENFSSFQKLKEEINET